MTHTSSVWVACVARAMSGSATFKDAIAATTAASARHTTAVTAPVRDGRVIVLSSLGLSTRRTMPITSRLHKGEIPSLSPSVLGPTAPPEPMSETATAVPGGWVEIVYDIRLPRQPECHDRFR